MTKINLPAGYFVQNGCHNCQHCFLKYDYDSYPSYFCTYNAPPRPNCLSVAMDEWGENAEEREAWHGWSENREVKSYGICDFWERQLPENQDL